MRWLKWENSGKEVNSVKIFSVMWMNSARDYIKCRNQNDVRHNEILIVYFCDIPKT